MPCVCLVTNQTELACDVCCAGRDEDVLAMCGLTGRVPLDDQGRVRSIKLSDSELTGSFSVLVCNSLVLYADDVQAAALHWRDVQGHIVTRIWFSAGPIPQELAVLTMMTNLEIDQNEFSGNETGVPVWFIGANPLISFVCRPHPDGTGSVAHAGETVAS